MIKSVATFYVVITVIVHIRVKPSHIISKIVFLPFEWPPSIAITGEENIFM